MLRLKLIKGRSYLGSTSGGSIKATVASPFVTVPDEDAERLLKTGYFKVVKEDTAPVFGVADTDEETDETTLLTAEVDFDELSKKSVEELRAFAEEYNIDLGKAETQQGVFKKISEALSASQTMLELQK